MNSTRRSFIKNTIAASTLMPLTGVHLPLVGCSQQSDKQNISIFSKHLQFLDYKQAGQIAAEIGFDGIDLTVRPKGHVLPEKVLSDLPKAINDINNGGSSCKMITSSIESATKQYDIDVIQTAANAGVLYYRSNWFKYLEDRSMPESLEGYKEQVYQLGLLNKKHGIVGCYQNHAGIKIGSSYWEIQKLLEKVDHNYFGTQYDIRQATVDGGYSWENGVKLLQNHIKVIALKDFKWGKEDGKWKAINVPIGDGMVDFDRYFKLLKSFGLNPPATLHLEYPLGGAEHGDYSISVDHKIVFDAMKKDLLAIRNLWKAA